MQLSNFYFQSPNEYYLKLIDFESISMDDRLLTFTKPADLQPCALTKVRFLDNEWNRNIVVYRIGVNYSKKLLRMIIRRTRFIDRADVNKTIAVLLMYQNVTEAPAG